MALNGTAPRFTVSGIASSKPTNEIKPITAMMAKRTFQCTKCIRAALESGPIIGAISTMEVIIAINLIPFVCPNASCTVT